MLQYTSTVFNLIGFDGAGSLCLMTVMEMSSLNFHPDLVIQTDFSGVECWYACFSEYDLHQKVSHFDCLNYNVTSRPCELPDLIRLQITEVRMMKNNLLLHMVNYQRHRCNFLLFAGTKTSWSHILPPTLSNLLQHVLRVYLWKVADRHSPPEESVNITNLGWEFKLIIVTQFLQKCLI